MASSSSFGGTIKLKGESEYQKALSGITNNLKVLNSEMKMVTSQYDKNDKSTSNLSQQNDILNKKIEEQSEKVRILKSALAESEVAFGKESSTTQKWQTDLNNAQAELNKLENTLKNNNQTIEQNAKGESELAEETKKAGEEASKSSEGYTVFKNVIANLTTQAINKAVDSLKQLGSAMIDLGKQAVSNYADYEQLAGGVETLFGDSADAVKKYANDAYATAGLSANQYMETVTSFSASMIQSLGKDTDAAAQKSNQAITDMSDNANKMGTDMSMIQSAYQGFAKQNYTMLDNLKLGYGGTKTEMERLLADATKITGIKYDVSNFADVTDAIHAIQVEMGISGMTMEEYYAAIENGTMTQEEAFVKLGTTAKEGMFTIQGSISTMQGAWSNLIAGLGQENANFEELINNLMTSLIGDGENGGVINNILPVVERVANAVVEVLPQILEKITAYLPNLLTAGQNILTSLITGITSNMPQIMTAVMQIINMLITTIVQNLPQILQAGITILTSLIQGIADSLPTLIPVMIDSVLLMVETLIDNIDLIIDAGIQLILGLADGLINALPDLIDKIPVIIDKLVDAIVNNLPKIIEMGITLIVKLAEGLIKAIPQLVSKIPQIIKSLVDGFKQHLSNMADVGLNLVKGIWNGISDATSWILDKIKGFGKSVLNGIKNIFGIHSPSTVFRDQIGKNLALGIGEGFTDEMKDVNNEIQNALPTDLDLGTDVNLSSNINSSNGLSGNYGMMVSAFKEALNGMTFRAFDEKFGELVIDNVEKVVYS